MANFEQMHDMKVKLYDDLIEAIEKSRVNIGCGLLDTDIMGVIDKVKLEFWFESNKGDL